MPWPNPARAAAWDHKRGVNFCFLMLWVSGKVLGCRASSNRRTPLCRRLEARGPTAIESEKTSRIALLSGQREPTRSATCGLTR
jgi:hypothetical protein